MSDCCSGIIVFSTTESKLQETLEESYYRRNLGQVSRVQAIESLVVAALARFSVTFLNIHENFHTCLEEMEDLISPSLSVNFVQHHAYGK